MGAPEIIPSDRYVPFGHTRVVMCADVCAGGEGDAQGSSGRAHDDSLKALPVQSMLCIYCGYLSV